MNTDSTELQNLLRLKRYETPSDEYFDDFLDEFHRRQREDVLKRSARSLLVERVSVWFKELGMAKWAYGAGVAYAALMLAFVAWPKGGSDASASNPAVPTLEPVLHEQPAVEPEEKDKDEPDF